MFIINPDYIYCGTAKGQICDKKTPLAKWKRGAALRSR
jgi:hypothetical protein